MEHTVRVVEFGTTKWHFCGVVYADVDYIAEIIEE
jgi:hypothetical protein